MVQRIYKQQELKIAFFFNGQRGLKTFGFLKKKLDIKCIFLAKKSLDKKILKNINEDYKIIKTLKDPVIFKIINKRKINLIISAGFPYIFREEFFDKKNKIDILNLHGGPLPRYRGGSPLVWQKIEGKKKIGISVIKANKYIDGGKLMGTKFFSIRDKDNIRDIQNKSDKLFCNLLWNVIKKYYLNKDSNLNNKKQLPSKYYPQRKPIDSLINLSSMNSNQVNNFHKALVPIYEAPFLYFKKKKVSLLKLKTTNIKSNFKIGFVEKIKNNYYLNLKDKKLRLIKTSMNIKKINNQFLRSEN